MSRKNVEDVGRERGEFYLLDRVGHSAASNSNFPDGIRVDHALYSPDFFFAISATPLPRFRPSFSADFVEGKKDIVGGASSAENVARRWRRRGGKFREER